MKKITLLLAFLLAVATESYGQISGYGFSESTEVYTAVTGTNSTATGDDGSQNAVAIGFTFKFDGVDYTTFSINTNGFIRLGANIAGSSWINSVSNTAAQRPLVAPFWDDNHRNTGSIQYIVTGVAPNQILEVGWDAVNIGGSGGTSATNLASYKLRLYETTNVIEFVYGPTMAAAGTLTASVGLNGAASFLSVTPGAISTASSATANNIISATTDLVGKKYIFTPPSCAAPAGITPSVVTTTTATVSWTAIVPAPASGYEYVVSTSNTAPAGAGTPTTNASEPIVGLTPATVYYVFVRSNCGGTFSGWNGPVSFATSCVAVTAFSENFDTAVAFPTCWAKVGAGGSANVQASASASSAPNNLYLYSSSITSLGVVSMVPVSNAGAGTHRLRFKLRANFTVGGNVEVGYLTNPTDDATFVSVQTFTATSATVYDNFNATLGTAPGANEVLAFRHTGSPANSVLIDDVAWEPIPSCVEPSNLLANNVTTTTADLVWDAVVGSVNYEYVLDNVVTAPVGAGTSTTAVNYSATSLTPATAYYFHVRNNCGAEFSPWSTVLFTTLPTPPVNDNCAGAIVLTPAGDFASGAQAGTIFGATTTAGVTPTCQASFGSDVWYTVVVPASGTLTIETQVDATNSLTDSVIAAFSGTCGALTEVGCDDDGGLAGPNANMSLLSLTGQTPGATLYVGVWKYAVAAPLAASSQFKVAAYDATLGSNSFDNAGFSYYPNPVKNMLNLSYTQDISDVAVYNLLGQQVIAKAINANQSQIDMSQLASGTYMVKVTADNQVKTIKVVKE